ncbi:MAG: DUF3131 domain-containing protein, partial [Candidatus Omnitrophica bacterium]|nr:DUF3131 domain-containing protein [Candidatus Omnitrophota bacterium]
EEDGVNHGRSLLVEYSIAAGETARFFAPLKGLDMSRADFLVFLARQKELDAFGGKILIGLRDVSGKTVTTDVRSYMKRLWSGPRSAWVQVAIPKTEYRSLDFNQLERLEIALTAGDQKISGNLVLDEISFFGPSELVFRSNADNLKGFPKTVVWDGRVRELMQIQNDHKLIQAVARDTWQYFENLIDRQTGLPVDHIRVGEALGIGAYVSPTNLGLYWIATVAAFDLSLISKEEAIANIRLSFASFKKLNHWGVGYYNYYQTRSFGVTREYVSVVDNGWLAAALVVIRQAFPEEFGKEASEALKKLDFSEFYDSSNGQLRLGFDADKGDFSPYHYGLLATEARLASYVAIGKGDLGKEHWARIYRTLPAEWDWQKQTPQGSVRELFGVPVFEGFYTYLGKQFVPSWGGSLFEFLAPTLLLKEQELAPKGLGKNNEIATDLQIQHALQERGYPVWGLAPCATRNGKYWVYREYGVPALGAKGYADRGVIAPYVSFLALATRPQAAIQNLREMLLRYPGIYGEYGFYDAVDLSNGAVNPQYLALDQAMSFLAMANYLKDGAVRKRFHADPVGKQGEELLKEEIFSLN